MSAVQADEADAGVATDEEPGDRPAQAFDQGMVNDVQAGFFGARIENVVLGAQTVRGHRSPATLTRSTGLVDDEDLASALERFVRPDGFADSATRLAHDPLVVLCAPPGAGKRSSALALLREVTDETLYMLSPNISLTELAEYEYEPGCGYLVVDRVVDKDTDESDFDWRVVRDRVADRKCYLVVTKPVTPVDGAEVFAHVAWRTPAADRVLRAYWQDEWPEEDAKVLADALGSVDRVRDVVGLARQLTDGKSLEDALGHLGTRVRAEVENWFDEATDPRRRALEVTTLAFTIGVDERTFEAALLRLQRRLDEYLPEPAREEGAVEEDHLHRRKRWSGNELVSTETLSTDLGTRGALRFAKPEQHRHVLAQLWQRMDIAFWDAVGDWLDEIVVRPRYELSVAFGVAELASVSLDEVLPVLDRWARGTRQAAGQRAAVFALYVMAYDESLAPTALRIATDWITRGKPAHRWVAAMAFIGGLGVRYPHDARRRLWQVCVQSHTVDGDVEQVFGELFDTLVRCTGNAHLVLNFLAEKLDRFARPGTRPAMRAVAVRTALAVLEARDDNTRRSSVLVHLAEFPEHTDLVARLMSSVLVYRPMRLRAIRALRTLLEDLARNEDDRARQRARALGGALRAKLPPEEHDPLEADFRIVAARKKDTDIGSLVDAILDALKGRVA